ncbi:MAG: rod shape-determining protein MreD [Alphaproteobacteria bacterium]|nr:MAG: rod shape-determining protein MreD [Alphaproteobacteria bacterium]
MPSSKLSFFRHSDQFYPWLMFLIFSLFISIIMAVPWPVLNVHVIMPNFVLMVMFIWIILRPEICQYSVFFLLGLWQDMLLSIPLGIHAVTNLVLLYAISQFRQYIFARNFDFIALSFAMTSTVYISMIYIIAFLFFGYHANLAVLTVKIISTNLLFPAMFAILLRLHRGVVNLTAPRIR